MKRFKAIFSLVIVLSFLLSTSGIVVYKHYCGDFLAALSIYSPTEGCCAKKDSCSKDESDMDCCDDETEFYQAELDLIKPVKEDYSFHYFVLPFEHDDKVEFASFRSTTSELNDRGPPLIRQPLYITLSRLTYYG